MNRPRSKKSTRSAVGRATPSRDRASGQGIKPSGPGVNAKARTKPLRSQSKGSATRTVDLKQEQRRMRTILSRLEREYPDSRCSLDYDNPLQLLIATILSAQCTDARVNQVTPQLFQRFPDAHALAEADLAEVEELIRSTGFYRNKAKSIVACCQALLLQHGGDVPQDLESLVALPGIGRKTANVVLGNAYGIPGVVVDTHVGRISQLLNLTEEKDPNKIERDLMQIAPRAKWTALAHLFIDHGRKVCIARRPQCDACVLHDLCPSSTV